MNVNLELKKLFNLPEKTYSADISLSHDSPPSIRVDAWQLDLDVPQLKTLEGSLVFVGKPAAPVLQEIVQELELATKKFPTWPTRGLDAVGVLNEEVGELNKEILQMTYESHKATHAAIRTEAIQVAAMAIRFCMSLEKYDYTPSQQHNQAE